MPTTVPEIAAALAALGCPADKCQEMAAQLDRRADQLAKTKARSRDEALTHLLRLMAAGWSAQAGGTPGPAVGE